MKYMVQLPEADHVLVSNSKSKLEKAHIKRIGSEYQAYITACNETDSEVEFTLNDFLNYNEIESYDANMISTYNFTVEVIN